MIGFAALRDDPVSPARARHLEGLLVVGGRRGRPAQRDEHGGAGLTRPARQPDLDALHVVLSGEPRLTGAQSGQRIACRLQGLRPVEPRRDVPGLADRHGRQPLRRLARRSQRLTTQPRRRARHQQEPDVEHRRRHDGGRPQRRPWNHAPQRDAQAIPRLARRREHVLHHRPRGAGDRQCAEQPDLGAELGLHRGDEQRTEEPDRDPEGEPRHPPPWDGPWVGHHEEHEQQHLGGGHEGRPERPARDRTEVPPSGHRVIGDGDDRDAGRERRPEAERDVEQPDTPEDHQAVGDDDGQGQRDPREHRAPPEVQRLRPRLP
jgi:hypothetical protein